MKDIHLMTFCCYSNHDQVAVVAKVKLLNDELWFVFLCGALCLSLACLWLQISCWQHYSPPVAMTTNSYSRVTFSTQTALCCSSEEIWKCHFLWKWEQLVLPRASTLEPFFLLSYISILRHPTQPQLNTVKHFYVPQQPASKKHLHVCVCVRGGR